LSHFCDRHVTVSPVGSIASGREVGNPNRRTGHVVFGDVVLGHVRGLAPDTGEIDVRCRPITA
jgi:hypothetical protein